MHDSKTWLNAVAASLNLTLSELARQAGVSPSTITRYVNDASNSTGISRRTMDKISQYAGVPEHVLPGEDRRGRLREPDAIPYSFEEQANDDWLNAAIKSASKNQNSVNAWTMRSWALDQIGVFPGDVLIVDMNRRPKTGDIVVAQVYDHVAGGSETIFRRYDPPYLTAHSGKLGPQKPLMVDDDTISVRGVMTGLLRHPSLEA